MEKRIVLEVVPDDGDVFQIQIIEQTHREEEFGNPRSMFESSMGFVIDSCSSPELYMENSIFYVRGSEYDADDNTVVVYSTYDMEYIMHAIREYNGHVILDKLPDVPTGISPFIVD